MVFFLSENGRRGTTCTCQNKKRKVEYNRSTFMVENTLAVRSVIKKKTIFYREISKEKRITRCSYGCILPRTQYGFLQRGQLLRIKKPHGY